MSNRRKIHPRDTARRDQAQAFCRDFTAAGGLVITRDYAPDGKRCCWCDCDAIRRRLAALDPKRRYGFGAAAGTATGHPARSPGHAGIALRHRVPP